MKNFLSIIVITAAILAMAGCDPFTTSYERIDDSDFRLLDFIYEPADASPGDIVRLTAVFAGKDIDEVSIDWRISFNVIRDIFGSQTIVDSIPLDTLIKRDEAWWLSNTSFSNNGSTYTVAFAFRIPNDIVKTNGTILENWTDVLRTYTDIAIPEPLASLTKLTKSQIVDMIDSIETNPAYFQFFKDIPDTQLALLLQLFTVPIRISAKINEDGKRPHTINSNLSVRYNRRFRRMYQDYTIPYNYNPIVDSVVIYKVKGEGRLTFNYAAADSSFLIYSLDNPVKDPVITIENGYTYFIKTVTDSPDWTTTTTGKREPERHHAYWQFRLDPEETKGVKYADYMDFRSLMGNWWSIAPPKDHRIKKFTFWVTVTDADDMVNERMRPEGSTLVEISGRFEYK